MQEKTISGFSKLSKRGKVRWVVENFFKDPEHVARELMSFWHKDEEQQRILDGFSENTISNYYLPYGVAPNFMINGKLYTVPMVIEESSVVAAASSAAKFWLPRGGFHATVLSTRKLGQVHFSWKGDNARLFRHFGELEKRLRLDAAHITRNMEERGGGVLDIELLDMTHLEPHYYQLKVAFETCDSMGANFINSVLEEFGSTLEIFVQEHDAFEGEEKHLEVIMAILSNYTPECIVRAWVECPVEALGSGCDEMKPEDFAEKFAKAVRIAHIDPHRAATHNKGIFNGVDAVVLATANDFRAVEACGHTYAARDGQYRSLSSCRVENGIFKFWLDLPLALGTIGGLTRLHPMASRSLELLGNPGAEELMMVIAATGLAQNFAALRSLVTTGIQKGHMKMHLMNILNHLEASEREVAEAIEHFKDKVVSFTAVREFLKLFRNKKGSLA
ncbi:MAG: hydroxymethylglutaryl-CoA reductase [Phaeodactylibacter sp.]|nr:hydroxymethylglutaryl-CoA reductase [Phaeodactylibacter sp.]MCB9285850.1 hydroxymethylglutaryl-CoA reductase [Lewinellaceae bacterium]